MEFLDIFSRNNNVPSSSEKLAKVFHTGEYLYNASTLGY